MQKRVHVTAIQSEPGQTVPARDDAASRILRLAASKLVGHVDVSGAKNSVLRLLAASLLTKESVTIGSYPSRLLDAVVHVGMLEALGKVCTVADGQITIREPGRLRSRLVWEGRSIRNTLLVLGALVARLGQGAVPLPGGCDLGDRKYDLHELVLRTLGAKVWAEDGMLFAEAPRGLVGAEVTLPIRSTGATENAILCGTLAKGTTRIWNPHVRPEILDLIAMLREMGAEITVFGQESIEIVGRDGLRGASHVAIADNMEAITWLIGSVITGGDVEIGNFPFDDLEVPLIFLRESGAKFYRNRDTIIVRSGRCFPVEISTGPYPGINSDMQPLFAAYGACAKGESRIVDLRFPDRYAYTAELAKLGVRSAVAGNVLRVSGGSPLVGTDVRALDLRAGIALTLLGLVASGETRVHDAWQVERGYDDVLGKLHGLGAKASLGR
jgi:UDP-N-acetylglucosamine 1-carboxyvinyltransferase